MRYNTRKATIPSDGGSLKLLILSPKGTTAQKRPGVLWIHGGGYVVGMPGMVHMSRAQNLVIKYGALVVSPEYRLAGQAPYPAALEDCHRALMYLKEHADELGVRSDQIMVGGESAGGGLAAALCMYEKDIGGVNIAFQMPLYPMIDDRDTKTSRDNHAPVWNTRRNHSAWSKGAGYRAARAGRLAVLRRGISPGFRRDCVASERCARAGKRAQGGWQAGHYVFGLSSRNKAHQLRLEPR